MLCTKGFDFWGLKTFVIQSGIIDIDNPPLSSILLFVFALFVIYITGPSLYVYNNSNDFSPKERRIEFIINDLLNSNKYHYYNKYYNWEFEFNSVFEIDDELEDEIGDDELDN